MHLDFVRATRLRVWVLALIAGPTACDASSQAGDLERVHVTHGRMESSIVSVETLAVTDTVVAPDLSPRTAWFQLPQSLHASSVANHFWAIDQGSSMLNELRIDGTLVGSFGRQGEGPEELIAPLKLIDTGEQLLVLDLAAQRIATFHRDGSFAAEVRLESSAWDVAVHDDGLLVVPGTEQLVDVYVGGRRQYGAGPPLGDSITCRSCLVAVLSDGRVVVGEPSTPRLFLANRDLDDWRIVDLRNETLADWRAQLGLADGRAGRSKDWIAQIVGTTGNEVLLLMSNPAPGPNGTEIWRVDLASGAIVRQLLSGMFVVSAVMLDSSIYGLLGEFRASATPGGHVLSEGSPAILRF